MLTNQIHSAFGVSHILGLVLQCIVGVVKCEESKQQKLQCCLECATTKIELRVKKKKKGVVLAFSFYSMEIIIKTNKNEDPPALAFSG